MMQRETERELVPSTVSKDESETMKAPVRVCVGVNMSKSKNESER